MVQDGALSGRRATFVAAMLTEPTILGAAEAAGISRNTATRWLKDPEIREALRQAQGALADKLTANLGAAVADAILALRAIVRDQGAPQSARVAAARALLDRWPEYVKTSAILARLDALEERQGGGYARH